ERGRLLTKRDFRFVDARPAPWLDAHAKRANRAGHPGGLARGVTRNLHALQVNRTDLVGEAETRELVAIRAERVGLDDVGARAHVLLMDFGDEIRLRQIQLIKAAIEKDAPRIQHRAHGAIADEYA